MLGMHISLKNPLVGTAVNANTLGLETFQIFLRNNRNLKRRSFTDFEVRQFKSACLGRYSSIVVHAPYSLNPCTSDFDKRQSYIDIVHSDLSLCDKLGPKVYYVLHPGSRLNLVKAQALANLVDFVLQCSKGFSTTICVEYMAGAGTQMLSDIPTCLSFVGAIGDKIKLCLDTCHMFASTSDWHSAFTALWPYTGVLHLNNSAFSKGSCKDRHASIECGTISSTDLLNMAKGANYLNPSIPVILETPVDTILDDYRLLYHYVYKV